MILDARSRWIGVRLLLGMGLCAFLFAIQTATMVRPLNWDEVDYVVAARRGIAANYFERGSLSLLQFVQLGRAKNSGDHTTLTALVSRLPPEADSLPNLRHNHPPLLTYLLAPWTTGSPGEERVIRMVYAVLVVGLVAGVWIGWTSGSGTLGLIVLFTSDAAMRTFGMINFHFMLAIAVALLLAVLPAALDSDRPSASIWPIAICAACVLLALETGIIVLVFVALGVFIQLRPWTSVAAARRFAAGAVIYGAATLVLFWLLWPGSILTGAPASTHLRLLYQVFFIANDDFARVRPLKAWRQLIGDNALLFAFIAAGIATFALRFQRSKASTRVAFVAGGCYCLAMTPFLAEVRYAFPGLLMLTVAAIDTLDVDDWKYRPLVSAALGGVVLLVSITMIDRTMLRQEAQRERDGLDRVMAALRRVDHARGPLLVDGAHIFRYYDPSLPIEKLDMLPSFRGGGLFVRRNYEYVSVDEDVGRHLYSAIVRQQGAVIGFGTRPPLPPHTRVLVDREYPRQEVVDRYWIAQAR